MKKLLFGILSLIVINSYGERVRTIVEFFSFTCKHCANVNSKFQLYIANHNVKYLDVNVDNSDMALPTNIMYYIALDAGVGPQFKTDYFNAIANGMPAYTPTTLNYVVNQIKTPKLSQLLASQNEREYVQQKLRYANNLLTINHIQLTPTFLINQTILLEGEDIIDSLNQEIR